MNTDSDPNVAALMEKVRAFMAAPDVSDEQAFNQTALEIFAFQFHHVPIYGEFCRRRGIAPGAVEHWSRIPALPVSAFKEYAVSSIAENERSRVFHSSGTTGQTPSRHFHDEDSLKLYQDSLLPWFWRHFFPGEQSGGTAGTRLIFLTPDSAQAPHSSLVHMFDTIRTCAGGAPSAFAGRLSTEGWWELDFSALEKIIQEAITAQQPVAILGTAFCFVHWLDRLAVNKTALRLPKGSRILETGGYKGFSRVVEKVELRRLITRYLNVPATHILSEYGMSELSSQAYDGCIGQNNAGVFGFPPWARAQIISPENGSQVAPGQPGLLRIFDLANVKSVMALQTEDLAAAQTTGFVLTGRAQAAEPRGCSLLAVGDIA